MLTIRLATNGIVFRQPLCFGDGGFVLPGLVSSLVETEIPSITTRPQPIPPLSNRADPGSCAGKGKHHHRSPKHRDTIIMHTPGHTSIYLNMVV